MKTARELHNQAMAVSAQADRSKRRGDLKEAQKLFQKAMQLGIGAAEQLDPVGSKLSWSIMMRSAASLAFLAGQMRTAERLACSALAGEPHPEVIHELRDVLEAIYLQPDDPEETHGFCQRCVTRSITLLPPRLLPRSPTPIRTTTWTTGLVGQGSLSALGKRRKRRATR